MQQHRCANGFSFIVGNFNAFETQAFYGLVGKAHGTYHVLKAGMHGSGINIVGEPQLFDAP